MLLIFWHSLLLPLLHVQIVRLCSYALKFLVAQLVKISRLQPVQTRHWGSILAGAADFSVV